MLLFEWHFIRPGWLLALLPIFWLVWKLKQLKKSQSQWNNLCDAHLLPALLVGASGRENSSALWLLATVWSLMVIALAGPSWEKIDQPVFHDQSARVIVLDLSKSMDAQDVSPSRLERAKFKVKDLLAQFKGGQTGLVVFAGEAYAVSPLTLDIATITSQLAYLSTELIPIQGSHISAGINKAWELIQQAGLPSGEIYVFSDGVDTMATSLESGKTVSQQGARLFIMGIGTQAGAPIPLKEGGYLKDKNGSIVIAKLMQDELNEIARRGKGTYIDMTMDDTDINQWAHTGKVEHRLTEAKQRKSTADYWQDKGIYLLWLIMPLAALAFRRGWLLILILCVLPPQISHAMEWQSFFQNENQRALRALKQGDYGQAIKLFEDPQWKAAAYYRAGQYEQALALFEQQNSADAHYNRGNTLARLNRIEEAIAAYDQALTLDEKHQDAKYNKDKLESLLKKNKQNSQNNSSDQKLDEKKPGNNQQNTQSPSSQPQGGQGVQQTQGKMQNQGEGDALEENNSTAATSQSQHALSTPRENISNQNKEHSSNQHDKMSSLEQKNQEQKNRQITEQLKQNMANQSIKSTADKNDATGLLQQTKDNPLEEKNRQTEQAVKQWLRKIPDDPGGLLRRKFLYQHLQQEKSVSSPSQNW